MKTKGEIATTLSIFALIVMSIGAVIGIRQTMKQQRLPDASAQFDPPLAEINVARHGRLTIRKGSYSVTNGVFTFLVEGTFTAGNTVIPGFREVISLTNSSNITGGYGGVKRTYMFPSETRSFTMTFFTRKDYACSSIPVTLYVKGPSQNKVGEMTFDLQKICSVTVTPSIVPSTVPTVIPPTITTAVATIPPQNLTGIPAPSLIPAPSATPSNPTPTVRAKPRIKVTSTIQKPDFFMGSEEITFYLFEYNPNTNSALEAGAKQIDVHTGVPSPDGYSIMLEHIFDDLKLDKKYVVSAAVLTIPANGLPSWYVEPPSTRCLHPVNAPAMTGVRKNSPEDYCIVKATADGLPGQDFGKITEVTGQLRIEGKSSQMVQEFYEFWPRMYTTQYDYESTILQKDLSYTNFLIPQSDSIRGLITHVIDNSLPGKPESVISLDFSRNKRIYEGDFVSIGMHYLDFTDSSNPPTLMATNAQNHVCKKPDFGGPYCTFTVPKGGLHLKFTTGNATPIQPIVNFLSSRGAGKVAGTITVKGVCNISSQMNSKITVQVYKEFFDKTKQRHPSRYDIVDRTIVLDDKTATTTGNNTCQYTYEVADLEANATYAIGVKKQKDIPAGVRMPVYEQTELLSPLQSCANPFIPASFHEDSKKFCKFSAKEVAPVIDFVQ
ncbi:MAG: hypothetical protein WBO77_02595 [Microgenomates group bacterium]